MTDRIASFGSILDYFPLDETTFKRSMSLLPWVRTWIGVNNIEPLTPEGWSEEGHGFKGGKKNDDGICIPYHSKGTFIWAPAPSVADLVLRKLGEPVHKRPNSLHVFIFPRLMMPVWGRLLLKMDHFVVYGPTGELFSILNTRVAYSWFYFSPYPTQVLAAQGDTQCSGTSKDGVFPAMGYYRGYRECSEPTLVTPKEGGLHVRSVGTGIASQLTRIGSRIITGQWRMWKVYLGILIPRMELGPKT